MSRRIVLALLVIGAVVGGLQVPSPTARAGLGGWTTTGPEGGLIQALAIGPPAIPTLYAGGQRGGIAKSTNNAESPRAPTTA
jgi:hypothetical protein